MALILFLLFPVLVHIPPVDANRPPIIKLHLPYSGKTGFITISEDLPVTSYMAFLETIDEDEGLAGQATCTTDNAYVHAQLAYPKAYKIVLKSPLDRETDPVFPVVVVCQDNGTPSLTTTENFTVEVVDVNDNPPVFAQTNYNASVAEGVEIGTLVTTITATDADFQQNGLVHYSLHADSQDGSRKFTIDNATGQIFTHVDLDREAVSQYSVTVIAHDSGLPSLSSSVQLTIFVEDINDNIPSILTREIHVKENLPGMTQVGILLGTDADTGNNSKLTFSKLEDSDSLSNPPFFVQAGGEIFSVVSLDREQRAQYSLAVLIKDNGRPRLNSTAVVMIIVEDENDNAPIVKSPCLNILDEEITPGPSWKYSSQDNASDEGMIIIDWFSPEGDRLVFQVEAEDPDIGENGQLRFSVEPDRNFWSKTNSTNLNQEPLFEINEATGKIVLARYVQQGDVLQQILAVTVTDKGQPALSGSCLLNVSIDVDVTKLPTTNIVKVRRKSFNSSSSRKISSFVTHTMWIVTVLLLFTNGQSNVSLVH